jgi:hypothetical protein
MSPVIASAYSAIPAHLRAVGIYGLTTYPVIILLLLVPYMSINHLEERSFLIPILTAMLVVFCAVFARALMYEMDATICISFLIGYMVMYVLSCTSTACKYLLSDTLATSLADELTRLGLSCAWYLYSPVVARP